MRLSGDKLWEVSVQKSANGKRGTQWSPESKNRILVEKRRVRITEKKNEGYDERVNGQ